MMKKRSVRNEIKIINGFKVFCYKCECNKFFIYFDVDTKEFSTICISCGEIIPSKELHVFEDGEEVEK